MRNKNFYFLFFIFLYTNISAQDLIKIDDKVYKDQYKHVIYLLKFKLKDKLAQPLYISKGAILSAQRDEQLLVICDIMIDQTNADSITDEGEFWTFRFYQENHTYQLAFKTYCLERGKKLPQQPDINNIPGITSGEKIPYDTLTTLCSQGREAIQKTTDCQGIDCGYNKDYEGHTSWQHTLELFIKEILEGLSYPKDMLDSLDFNFEITENGIISSDTIEIKKNDKAKNNPGETLYEIYITQNGEPEHKKNSNTYKLNNIDYIVIQKF